MSRDMEKCSLSHSGLWLLDGFDVDTDVSSIFIDKKRRWRINHDVWHVYVFRFFFFPSSKCFDIQMRRAATFLFRFASFHARKLSQTFYRGLQSFSSNRWHLKFICLLSFPIEFQVVFEIFIKPNGRHIFRKKLLPDTIFRFLFRNKCNSNTKTE